MRAALTASLVLFTTPLWLACSQTDTQAPAAEHDAGHGGAGGSPSFAAPDAGVGAGGGWDDEAGWGGGGGAGGAGGAGDGGDWVPTSPLEGGEIDDNANFEAYLDYAAEFVERVPSEMITWLDVSQRHVLTVLDADGNTVPDASVAVESESGHLYTGRTRADGRLMVHPFAWDPAFSGQLRVTASLADQTVTADLGPEDLDTTLTLAATPAPAPFRVDVAFVLDATGSMAGEIDRLKTTIDGIAGRLSDTEHAPELRFGLVYYRDRGDAYVTRHADFTDSVAGFRQALTQVVADGGGDQPEALNQALEVAMGTLSWRPEATLRLMFVVADAPAHHYADAQYIYTDAMRDAVRDGVTIFPIASGGSDGIAEFQFRQLAQFTQGHFIFITEGGGSSGGSEGSDYEVDPSDFEVEQLDDLVVRLVEAEMDAWHHSAD